MTVRASWAELGIQNCGCKFTFNTKFEKSVGANLKDSKVQKDFSQKLWVQEHPLHHANSAPVRYDFLKYFKFQTIIKIFQTFLQVHILGL